MTTPLDLNTVISTAEIINYEDCSGATNVSGTIEYDSCTDIIISPPPPPPPPDTTPFSIEISII